MSDNQDKLPQKPIVPANYQDEDEETDLEDDYVYDEEDEDDEDYYEDEDDEDEEGQYDPYALAQQLTSSPMFAQVQAMLGGGGSGVDARMNAARLQQATGDLEGAAETYLDIIEEDPEHQKAHVALGQVLMAMDRIQEAEVFLGKAVALEPDDASGHLYLGYAHYGQENFEKSVEDFKRATELDPESHISWNNLGYVQYLTGQLDAAEKTFVKAGDVGNERAYYNLGLIRLLLGNEKKAWEAYQDAADLDPRNTQIEDHLGDLEQAKTRYPDRVALLDQAILRLNERFGTEEDDTDDDDEPED